MYEWMEKTDKIIISAFNEYFKSWSKDHSPYDTFRAGWDAAMINKNQKVKEEKHND